MGPVEEEDDDDDDGDEDDDDDDDDDEDEDEDDDEDEDEDVGTQSKISVRHSARARSRGWASESHPVAQTPGGFNATFVAGVATSPERSRRGTAKGRSKGQDYLRTTWGRPEVKACRPASVISGQDPTGGPTWEVKLQGVEQPFDLQSLALQGRKSYKSVQFVKQ